MFNVSFVDILLLTELLYFILISSLFEIESISFTVY